MLVWTAAARDAAFSHASLCLLQWLSTCSKGCLCAHSISRCGYTISSPSLWPLGFPRPGSEHSGFGPKLKKSPPKHVWCFPKQYHHHAPRHSSLVTGTYFCHPKPGDKLEIKSYLLSAMRALEARHCLDTVYMDLVMSLHSINFNWIEVLWIHFVRFQQVQDPLSSKLTCKYPFLSGIFSMSQRSWMGQLRMFWSQSWVLTYPFFVLCEWLSVSLEEECGCDANVESWWCDLFLGFYSWAWECEFSLTGLILDWWVIVG